MKKTLIVVTAVGVVAAGVGFLTTHREADTTAAYRLVPVERGDVRATVTATGTLSAVRTVQVGTQVSGQIAELYADFNDHVRKGQLIAKLDPTILEQAVRLAEADLARAQADYDQQAFALDQEKKLYDTQAATETEYRTAQYNVSVARASLTSARAGLERAQQNLRYTSIYAPIDGVVIERDVDVGQTVAASFSAPQLFLIAEDLGHMQILASVDESDIGQIQNGQPVQFTVQAYAGRTFTGTVRQVRMQSQTTENVVSYTVVVAVENPDGTLLPGMTATVSFEIAGASDVLKVPNAALRFRATDDMLAADTAPADGSAAGGQRLWYVDDAGRVAVTQVRTGITDGQMTEITGPGVHAGMQAIAGVTSESGASSTASNPFQRTRQQGGPPPPPGAF